MDRRQRKRILIFLLVPVLAAILFITDDLLIRVITIILIIIYFAFIIFLRDSVRFQGGYTISEDDEEFNNISSSPTEFEESFKIISKTKEVEVIDDKSYSPDFSGTKVNLKPPNLKQKFEEIAYEELPKGVGHDEQFSFVLDKMLTVIKEAYNAYTAIFFWYNEKKEKLTVEKFVSVSEDITKAKFDIEDDILSKIVQSGEPELLSEIPPAAETDVIRYYSSEQNIRSFVGVPLFYDKTLIAILAVDSKEQDAFGIETIYALGRFIRVITLLITIFEEKHSDSLTQQRLKGIMKFIGPDSNYEDEKELIQLIHSAAETMVSCDAFSFVYYNPVAKNFQINKVVNNTSLKYIGESLEIELRGTLVGKSIRTGLPVKIDDTSDGNYIRYSKAEDLSFDGSFLVIPIIYSKQIYGLLCFENLKRNAFTNQDVQYLKNSLNIFSYIIYSQSTRKLLESLTAIDMETRTLNADTFRERLRSDLIKARDVKTGGAIALIRIDDFLEEESLFNGDPLPKVIKTVAEIVENETSALNLVGRLNKNTLAIYFFNSDSKKVFVWAEKLRIKVARKPIAVLSKQSTYTISIGVASTTKKVNPDEVIEKANLALQKAIEKGGNSVQNIN